jgi:hypothetical protein
VERGEKLTGRERGGEMTRGEEREKRERGREGSKGEGGAKSRYIGGKRRRYSRR